MFGCRRKYGKIRGGYRAAVRKLDPEYWIKVMKKSKKCTASSTGRQWRICVVCNTKTSIPEIVNSGRCRCGGQLVKPPTDAV